MSRQPSHAQSTNARPSCDTDLHVRFISEEAGLEIRTLELAPAPPRPVPAYPYAKVLFHVGAYRRRSLVSVGSFILEDMDEEEESLFPGLGWRIRGMATASDFRGLGYASAVLDHGLRELRRRGGLLVWCNGRSTARAFYLHHGFEQLGEERHLPGLQPHYRFRRTIGGSSARRP